MYTITKDRVWVFGVDKLISEVAARFISLSTKISMAYQIRKERIELKKLSDEILFDIGLDRSDVEREADRSMFDLPESRLNEDRSRSWLYV